MKFENYKLWISLSLMVLLTACIRPDIGSWSRPDTVSGRDLWSQMVTIKSLKADAIMSWRGADGKHGKYRIRLFVSLPDKLKIQWLTPWGSVAGQLLLVDKQFWLSDAGRKQTRHGQAAGIDEFLQNGDNSFQSVAARFFTFWPLLFNSPEADDANFADSAVIEYFSAADEDDLTLIKEVAVNHGEKLQIRLFAMEESGDRELMPLAYQISSRSGSEQVVIKLRRYDLSPAFTDDTFVYKLKNFTVYESM